MRHPFIRNLLEADCAGKLKLSLTLSLTRSLPLIVFLFAAFKEKDRPGMVAHSYNLNSWEAEVGGLGVLRLSFTP